MIKFLIFLNKMFTIYIGIILISSVFGRMPPKYDDFYARHKLWPMANLFYNTSITPSQYMDQCFNSSEFYKLVHLPCDMFQQNNTNIMCTGAVAVSHDDEAVLLFFQGTVGTDELAQELTFYNITVPFPGGGTVAKFWFNGFQIIWNGGLRDAFFTAKNTYPKYELWVFGYSMGGSLASNAAAFISYMGYLNPVDIKMITFGQTRVGDATFVEKFEIWVPYAYRVTHNWDIAPHVIPDSFGYRHFKNEIWYPNQMAEGDAYIECDEGESLNCSNSVPSNEWTWFDHVYFPLEGNQYGVCKKSTRS